MKLLGINIIGWFFTFLVGVFLIVLVQVVWGQFNLLLTGTRTEGIVVDVLDEGDVSKIVVEFTTKNGKKITYQSLNSNAIPSAQLGQLVKVVYKESNPNYAQVLLWGETKFFVILALLWFIGIFLLIWLGVIKSTGDESMGDPLHLLPKAVWLIPYITVRTTAYLVLAFGVFGFGLTGNVFATKAYQLRTSGIKVKGIVSGFDGKTATTNGRTTSSEDYALITYSDSSGGKYTIKKSIFKLISNIKIGDTRDVIYPKGKPDKGVEDTWWVLWFPTFFFIAIVIFFITLMFVLYIHPEWGLNTTKKN